MPELRLTFGYPAVLGLMAAVTVGMVSFFRRKGWIGSEHDATTSSRIDQPDSH